MTTHPSDRSSSGTALRLWPGLLLAVLLWVLWYVVPRAVSSTIAGYVGVLGGVVLALAVLVWWAFFSRAPRSERWGAIGLVVAGLFATPPLLHESVATAGQGVMFYFYALPVAALALVAWAVATRHLPDRTRRVTLVATLLLAFGGFTLLRTEGVSTEGSQFAFRWSPTPEERLLARAEGAPAAAGRAALESASRAEWPGFRGPERNGHVPGVEIASDWTASPPTELWRQPVGPGWSSFAVHGDLIYTQEQRGEEESVSCYDAATGEPVWRHADEARFWESNGGAGPRGTPTLRGGRVYAFGATGILNALDAADGTLVWSRNAGDDANVDVPYWGFASSPLVVDDVVVVAVSGRLAAYDLVTGEPRWLGPEKSGSYSSPHLVTLDGVPQILLLSGAGATSVAPSDGTVLWEHEWPGSSIVQPALTPGGDLLLSADMVGTRRLAVSRAGDAWSVEALWTSNRLKANFNDFVIHEGHAYGFDGKILAAIDLENGERQWKGGRYGQGQLVLLPDQDLLLVVTEMGDLALVEATPDRFTELARVPALDGKTWNHPVLVGDRLLVRNDREMVAFRLAPDDASGASGP